MKKESLGIIDHVGAKAGMDYYSGLLAAALARKGLDVIIFSNFKSTEAGVRSYQYFIGHSSSKLEKATNYFTAFFKSAYTCRKHSCRQVIIHMFSYELKELYALLVLKLFGIKIIAIIHDVESFASKDSQALKNFIFSKLDLLVVHNKFSESTLVNSHPSIAKKISIIPHGNFHDLFSSKMDKAPARQMLGLPGHLKYVLFFGQIKKVKGLDILLKAMALLPENIHLIIAGKPWKEDFNAYEALIKELHLEPRVVRMIHFIKDSERNLLFRAADILVLPYKQIYQSGVMLMAMSAGISVLASNLEPMKEFITNNKTGFLFETENESSLASMIQYIVNNPLVSREAVDNAWTRVHENNNWDKIATSYLDLLNA